VNALSDEDIAVRQCAALALRHQPHDRAVPALIQALHGKDPMLANLAADALIAIGAPAVPALIDVMQNSPQKVRLVAVRALARIGDHRSIPVLYEALSEDSVLMEYWASEGLERMGVGMAFFKP
jgi:HEAT repeat protein